MIKKLAKKLLFDLVDIFEKFNIRYAVVDGVFLGAVRENDFIQWDNDIDISVFEQFWCDYSKMQGIIKELNSKEIDIVNCWNMTIMSFKRDKITVNVSYIMRNGKEYFKYNNMGKWTVPLECFDKLEKRNFLGRDIYFPSNADKFLTNEYGEDWRTPNKNFEYNNFSEKNKIKGRKIIRTVFTYEE